VLAAVAAAALRSRAAIGTAVRRYFTTPGSAFNLAIARILWYVAVLISLPAPGTVQAFAKLPSALEVAPANGGHLLAHLPLISALVEASYWIVLSASILGLLGILPRLSSAAVVVAGFYYLGIPQLYGKVNHSHHLLWIAAILAVSRSADALSVQALWRAWRRPATQAVEPLRHALHYSLPLRFIWIVLGVSYLSAGAAKYRFDGLEWFNPHTLATLLHLHWYQAAYHPPLIARPDHVAPFLVLGATFTLVFETTYIVWIFVERARPVLAAPALLFHNSTYYLMHIGFWTLQVVNLSLVDWERVSQAILRRRSALFFAYDGNCGIREKTAVGLRSLSPPDAIEFVNALDQEGLRRQGLEWLDQDAIVADLHVVVEGRTYVGYEAYRRVAARIPLLWPAVPLLYVAPITALGRRIYRRVADGRSCAVGEALIDAPAPRHVSTIPIVAIGAVTTVALGSVAMYGLASWKTSSRAISGWPVAAYPSFAGIGNDTTTVLLMGARTASGRFVPVDARRRLTFMTSARLAFSQRRQTPEQRREVARMAKARARTAHAAPAALGERVDPALQTLALAHHQLRVPEGVRQQRDSLVGGDERHGQVAGIAPAQLAELLLRPVDRHRHQLRTSPGQRITALVELRAEAPLRTAGGGDEVSLIREHPDVGPQPRPWRPVLVELREGARHRLLVRADRGGDQFILGLEVVVDVADRNISGSCDVRQRRRLDALTVQHLPCGNGQTLALAGARLMPLFRQRVSHLTHSSAGAPLGSGRQLRRGLARRRRHVAVGVRGAERDHRGGRQEDRGQQQPVLQAGGERHRA
jgi:predicted DCC family thiol-disulfide oxidoreductase YuxK